MQSTHFTRLGVPYTAQFPNPQSRAANPQRVVSCYRLFDITLLSFIIYTEIVQRFSQRLKLNMGKDKGSGGKNAGKKGAKEGGGDGGKDAGKVKSAQSINVRHILVRHERRTSSSSPYSSLSLSLHHLFPQCFTLASLGPLTAAYLPLLSCAAV